jgi:hypothetical protein
MGCTETKEHKECIMRKLILTSWVFIRDHSIIFYLAIFKLVLHMFFYANYGYFRDEFYYIACSDHLAFGYVDHPPLSIIILRLSRLLLGDSLFVIRLLPALAGAGVVVMTGLMVRRLGGGKYAQGLAALAVTVSPVMLGLGRFFSMNAFDILFWTIAAFIVVLIVESDNRKLWIMFGIVVGLGLLNKYSIGFFCIGLVAGLVLTRQRKHLVDKWFWLGNLIALGLFLPHIAWQIRYGFPTLEFMRNATLYKNLPTPPLEFLMGQFLEVGFGNALLWLPGLYYCFFYPKGKRYRLFGWMYVVIFVTMVATNGKVYYLSPIYPLILALGAVAVGRLIHWIRWNCLKTAVAGIVLLSGIVTMPFAIPVFPVDMFIAYQNFLGLAPPQEERSEVGVLPQHYADMFGWEEMVDTVAMIYQELTPNEQAECIIFTRNYGQAGAIDFFGKRYGLPKASCGHNNYWLWGPPRDKTGDVAIIFGNSLDVQKSYDDLKEHFEDVVHVATFTCTYCMPYENNRPIFVCRNIHRSIQEIWPGIRFYI